MTELLPNTVPVRLRAACCVVVVLPLLAACSDFKDEDDAFDTGEQVSAVVTLVDRDVVSVDETLSVEVFERQAGADLVIDWSALTESDDERPLDVEIGVAQVLLRQFPDLSPEEVAAGLVDGELAQTDVGLSVRCTASDTATCAFSEFTFEAGHAVSVPEEFVEDSGTWLLELRGPEGGPSLARAFVLPTDGGVEAPVIIADPTSVIEIEVAESPALVQLHAVSGTVVDWSALTETSSGAKLNPARVEELTLVRTVASDPVRDLMLHPEQVATDAWTVDVYGDKAVHLGQLWADGRTAPTPDEAGWYLVLRGGDHDLHETLAVVPLYLE